ncbi:hypothetical protein L3Q72_06045 [Vibrio sp. JC009]|uniref:DUF6931 family protein n=1 Tax=Vibrio sp. JC009 TaxID=2912314 RepID=UPI0023AEA42C|nr:hypothetical protein [Vibrio sp. JC009]WED22953.1 hypothetical protein L3Q72_06045 [Vibrio sp. JC009]
MEEIKLDKVVAQKASEIISLYEPEEEVLLHLNDGLSPAEFITALTGEQLYSEALHYMVYALPKRESVWLACVIYRQNSADNSLDKSVESAEKWVYTPDESNRSLAMKEAEAAGYGTPAGLIAAGAAWSGGSLTGPENPPVPPAEDLTAKAVWAAITILAYQSDPETVLQRFHHFLQQSVDIANGGDGRLSQP